MSGTNICGIFDYAITWIIKFSWVNTCRKTWLFLTFLSRTYVYTWPWASATPLTRRTRLDIKFSWQWHTFIPRTLWSHKIYAIGDFDDQFSPTQICSEFFTLYLRAIFTNFIISSNMFGISPKKISKSTQNFDPDFSSLPWFTTKAKTMFLQLFFWTSSTVKIFSPKNHFFSSFTISASNFDNKIHGIYALVVIRELYSRINIRAQILFDLGSWRGGWNWRNIGRCELAVFELDTRHPLKPFAL